jgi:hypothetical protein
MSNKSSENDEWKIVTHKRVTSKYKTTRAAKSKLAARHVHSQRLPESLPVDESVYVVPADTEKAIATIETFQTRWAESVHAKQLNTALRDQVNGISTAVIAGLGNLDPTAIRDRFRASWQLAVFLEILGNLKVYLSTPAGYAERKVLVYAQDPAFTSFDRALLSRLEISVSQGSGAVDRCDSNSLLFVPFVDAVVLLPQIIKDRDPAIYVGSDIAEVMDRMSMKGYAEQ